MRAIAPVIRGIARQVWFRAAIFTVVAVAFALFAGLIESLIPFTLSVDLGQGSVGTILQIIATSMLTVTTFSLTAMVTAYSSATTIGTPRATQLLIEDRTSQNVLSTFVGSFAFALVGIIALSTGYYADQGRTILFFGTLVVVAVIVITLLRWIAHLSTFGRMSDVIDRVEEAAADAARTYAARPTLGAMGASQPPAGSRALFGDDTGYVTHVDVAALDAIAKDAGATVFVTATPGRFIDASAPIAYTSSAPDAKTDEAIARSFRVERHRTYEQDPRLGLIALAEIASRALSPATNDPGTAIEVVGSLHRVFGILQTTDTETDVPYPRVRVTPVPLSDMIEDAFRPIARDGAGVVEVQIKLQKCLATLARNAQGDAHLFRRAADAAAQRADDALSRADRRLLRDVRRDAF